MNPIPSGNWWQSLPRPKREELGVYLFGSGVGESIVILSPEGWAIVVDACEDSGVNLPLGLVRAVGASVALVIITHPDLDHIRGMADLVRETGPGEVWRYPLGSALTDAIVRWARELNPALSDALAALDAQQRTTGAVFSVTHGLQWSPSSGSCSVRAFAPTPYDQSRVGGIWDRLVGPRAARQNRLNGYLRDVVAGRRRLGSVANVLSIGAVLTWGQHKLVLGGDVMCGTRCRHSGWKGVIDLLDRRGPPGLLDRATLVKAAHHGSTRSYEPLAWNRHASGGRTRVVLAPYKPSGLPPEATLTALREHTVALGVSHVDRAIEARVVGAGWSRCGGPKSGGESAPDCVGAILEASGGARLWSTSNAAVFE